MPLDQQNAPRYRFGPFEVCLETGELLKNGRRIHLQRKPFEILIALLEQPGRLVTRENLRQRLWSADTFVDFDNGLNTALSKLRDTLGDTAETPRYIETMDRRGYRFVATVEEFATGSVSHLRELDVKKKHIRPDVVLVELAGKIIYGPECQQLEWLLTELLTEGERKVIFDISHVHHIDSTGVGIMVMCSAKMKGVQGELRIAGAEGHVKAVLKITEVDKILRLYTSSEQAFNGFSDCVA